MRGFSFSISSSQRMAFDFPKMSWAFDRTFFFDGVIRGLPFLYFRTSCSRNPNPSVIGKLRGFFSESSKLRSFRSSAMGGRTFLSRSSSDAPVTNKSPEYSTYEHCTPLQTLDLEPLRICRERHWLRRVKSILLEEFPSVSDSGIVGRSTSVVSH